MGDLITLVRIGEQNVTRLGEPSELRAASEAFMSIIDKEAVDSIIPASEAAQRLIGAMLATDLGRSYASLASAVNGTVLLIDVNLASGATMAGAAMRLRRAGAQRVLGAVLHQLIPNAPNADDCALDELFVLQSSTGGPPNDVTLDLLASGISN